MRTGGGFRADAGRCVEIPLGRPPADPRTFPADPAWSYRRYGWHGSGHPYLRWCRARIHTEIRHQNGNLRRCARQGQPSCRQQPACIVSQGAQRRRRDERPGDSARRHDPPDGLPADLWRRGGDPGVRAFCEKTWPAPRCGNCRPGHDHRHPRSLQLRKTVDARLGGHPHDPRRRGPGIREGWRRSTGHRRLRTARLLRPERSDLLRVAGFLPRGRGREVRDGWRQHLRRADRDQSVRRSAFQGASVGCDRFGAVLRADPAIAWKCRAAAGRRCAPGHGP
ncbi:hypothetical protein D3C78_1113200 [compost metagenome]